MKTKQFDKAAVTWDNNPRRVQLAEKISAAVVKLPLNKSMAGMEFGCGTGLVSLALAPKLKTLTALDSSQGMLEVLQEKIDEQQLTNIHCLHTDIFQDAHKEQYDLIVCAMTLHHLQDADGALKRFSDLLNPGGYLAVADLVTEDGSFHDPSVKDIYHKGFDTEKLGENLTALSINNIHTDIVHTIKKENAQEYPIFLLTGQKK
jgi:ubiquinone/menaquinone biosynthesis C-methylase UbiE